MLLSIEPDSDIPIYLQLRNQIVEALVVGQLLPGDSLPSVRQLARDLGINLHTVSKAYQLLEAQGYLHIHNRRGARLTTPANYSPDFIQKLHDDLLHLYIEAQSHGVSGELFMQQVDAAIEAANRRIGSVPVAVPGEPTEPTEQPPADKTPGR